MSQLDDPLHQAEAGHLTKFSKLEASLVNTELEQRPNSRAQNDIDRYALASDLSVNELAFDFDLNKGHYPLGNLKSLQQSFESVQYHEHLKKIENFSSETQIECLNVECQREEWSTLDETQMDKLLKSCHQSNNTTSGHRMLVFFVPLTPVEGTSYGARIAMTQENINQLFKCLELNPSFIMNMIGRPDYWAPHSYWSTDSNGKLISCDLFCQHPRWNLQLQGAPLSVYMRYDTTRSLTTYVISHKEGDTSIATLKSLLKISLNTVSAADIPAVFLNDPFDIHIILSTLSFEASKFHVKRFQRFMWTQINKVDDQLDGLEAEAEAEDRAKLKGLTKQLQIISQNADSHLGNADVCIITATAIRNTHSRFVLSLPNSNPFVYQRAEDSISYVIDSMRKQKIWFLNYKQRKDSTMSLVYNLVTQQDASNNIQISQSMKQDSTSMNAIAALTMAFLPGTFAATVVSAGVFGGAISGARVWWVWVSITVPVTLAVLVCWWLYQKAKESENKSSDSITREKKSYYKRMRFPSGLLFRGAKNGILNKV